MKRYSLQRKYCFVQDSLNLVLPDTNEPETHFSCL